LVFLWEAGWIIIGLGTELLNDVSASQPIPESSALTGLANLSLSTLCVECFISSWPFILLSGFEYVKTTTALASQVLFSCLSFRLSEAWHI
jgi:hypothetical protein